MTLIGPATIFETFSAALIPILFGTSSPKIKVRNITMITMIPLERDRETDSETPICRNDSASDDASLSPEKIPVRIPIKVIPTWMAERNLSGSDASFKAVLAPGRPFSASVWRLDLRAEIRAISDIAKKPFRRIRKRIMKISLMANHFLNSAITVSHALTSSPTLTFISLSRGRYISILEPNLMIPHWSAFVQVSPTLA